MEARHLQMTRYYGWIFRDMGDGIFKTERMHRVCRFGISDFGLRAYKKGLMSGICGMQVPSFNHAAEVRGEQGQLGFQA